MKKNIKYLVFLVLFLVPALFSQIFAMEVTSKPDQRKEESCIAWHTSKGWVEDGRDERGGIIFKDSAGAILVAYDHLDIENAKPSPESTLWLSPRSRNHNGDDNNRFFSYWVVCPAEVPDCNPERLISLPPSGTQGLIWGGYYCTQTEGGCFRVGWAPFESFCTEKSIIARALDLAIDCFSEDTTMDFKEIKVIMSKFLKKRLPILTLALQELALYEKENEGPVPYSIEEKFNELRKSTTKNDLISNSQEEYTLKRRVMPLANRVKEG